MSKELLRPEIENVQLANGIVTSGANLGVQKALVDHQDLDSLIGRMMQIIEATYQDKEQREAQKSLVLDQLVEAAQELCRECVPERKPKVVKKRVTYAPYQPRVEKYKREGWNACREQMLTNLDPNNCQEGL